MNGQQAKFGSEAWALNKIASAFTNGTGVLRADCHCRAGHAIRHLLTSDAEAEIHLFAIPGSGMIAHSAVWAAGKYLIHENDRAIMERLDQYTLIRKITKEEVSFLAAGVCNEAPNVAEHNPRR
jgi:hypothetical protein